MAIAPERVAAATGAGVTAPDPAGPGAPGAIPAASTDSELASSVTRVARGGTLSLVGAVASGVLNFVLLVVLTRVLGRAGAGVFLGATSLFMLASNAAELGADTGLVRFVARYRALSRSHDVRRALVVSLVPVLAVSTLAAVAIAVFAPALAGVFASADGADGFATYVRWMAPFLPLSAAVTVVLAATRGFGAMAPTVVVSQLSRPALQPLAILAAHAVGATGAVMAVAWAGPIGLGVVPAVLWLRKFLRRAPASGAPQRAPRSAQRVATEFWRFTAPRGLAGMFEAGLQYVAVLLVLALGGPVAAGVFGASTRYLVAGRMLTTAITQAMSPNISGLFARRELLRARTLYQLTTAWSVALVWPIYLTLALFAPLLLKVFGEGFESGGTGLVVLAGAAMVSGACGPVNVVLLMGGRSSWSLLNTVLALVANVAGNFLLVPRYGITGAAIAWSAGILVANVAPLFQVWWWMAMHPFGRGVRRAALAATACFGGVGLAARALLGPGVAGFLAFVVVAVVAYALTLRRIGPDLELPLLWGTVRRRGAAARPS